MLLNIKSYSYSNILKIRFCLKLNLWFGNAETIKVWTLGSGF